jgi:hypothetical protein
LWKRLEERNAVNRGETQRNLQQAKMTSVVNGRFPVAGKKWKLRLTPVKRASNCFRVKPSQFMRTLHEFIEKYFGIPRSFVSSSESLEGFDCLLNCLPISIPTISSLTPKNSLNLIE